VIFESEIEMDAVQGLSKAAFKQMGIDAATLREAGIR